jgi:hypothetical protein
MIDSVIHRAIKPSAARRSKRFRYLMNPRC